uniref:Uncharacterized protein n=1 Tax=Corvus moneduloides TaxID=1196302 RepID=A0A8U7NU13_CORMO
MQGQGQGDKHCVDGPWGTGAVALLGVTCASTGCPRSPQFQGVHSGDATSPLRCPHPALALAGWCPLSPAGAQTTQLLVQPTWTPPVLWDRVTLTCQGSGTAAATTWYKDGQRWWQKGPDRFVVTESGTYQCDRPGTGLSPPMHSPDVTVPSCPTERLVLQVPAWALLEGDVVTLRCRGWRDSAVTGVQFYHEEKDLGGPLNGTELFLSPLQLLHGGRYRCGGWVESGASLWWEKSAPVTVTVVPPPLPGSLIPLFNPPWLTHTFLCPSRAGMTPSTACPILSQRLGG